MSEKRAVVLAGGKGTRLRPYTIDLPKPLVPVAGVPILEIIITQLKKSGFRRITMAVNHLAGAIQSYFGDGSKWDVSIDYSFEGKPLSTMGPLKLMRDLPENFLVMNGDILTDLDYSELFEDHVNSEAIFTISGYRRMHQVDFGVLEVDSNQKLCGFHEKPTMDYTVSMGVYILSNRALNHIPSDTAFGFDQLMQKMIDEKLYVNVRCYDGYWLDIGRPEDYETACEEASRFVTGEVENQSSIDT